MRERVYGAGIGVLCAGIGLAVYQLPWGWLGVVLVAALVGWAIGSHMRRLRRSAERDSLTGLNNRTPFERVLKDEYERAARYRRPLTLMFVEIDDFGRVNKSYGHMMGDKALRAVADQIRHSIRTMDLLARWGGDEFVVLLPETDLDQAYILAERIRATVQNSRVADLGHSTSITISTGIAACIGRDGKPEDLLRDAIEAQRKAKIQKNVVEVAS